MEILVFLPYRSLLTGQHFPGSIISSKFCKLNKQQKQHDIVNRFRQVSTMITQTSLNDVALLIVFYFLQTTYNLTSGQEVTLHSFLHLTSPFLQIQTEQESGLHCSFGLLNKPTSSLQSHW